MIVERSLEGTLDLLEVKISFFSVFFLLGLSMGDILMLVGRSVFI